MKYLLLLSLCLSLQACVVRKALDVATAPVKVVAKGVDAATTSQSEADEKRGKELRKQEERLGKLQRQKEKQERKCAKGDTDACEKVDEISDDITDELDRDI